MKTLLRLIGTVSLLALGACGPTLDAEDEQNPELATRSDEIAGPCTVTVRCPNRNTISCSGQNYCVKDNCTVLCDGVESHCTACIPW